MQNVSPLLVFDDKEAEADVTARLQRLFGWNDWRLYKCGGILNLLLAWHMARACSWRSPLPVLIEAALFVAVHWLSERHRDFYMQHRSLLLGTLMACHQVLVVKWVMPCLYGASSPSPLVFWLQELNHCLVPWIVLMALAYPIPLKHAVWSQAAVLACMLTCLPRQRQLSASRFAASEQQYMKAAQVLVSAVAAVLPPGLSRPFALELPRLLGPAGAFYLVHCAALLLGVAVTLLVLFCIELPCRMQFACGRGLANAVDCLMQRRSQWQRLGIPPCLALVAIGWTAGCIATLLLKAACLSDVA